MIALVAYMIDNFISLRLITITRKSQMTNVIHSDFLTLAKVMTYAFLAIENNQY